MSLLDTVVAKALDREPPTRTEALAVLSGDDELLDGVAAGARVRRHFFGHRVKLNTIINMKSGLCPEGLRLLLPAARLRRPGSARGSEAGLPGGERSRPSPTWRSDSPVAGRSTCAASSHWRRPWPTRSSWATTSPARADPAPTTAR